MNCQFCSAPLTDLYKNDMADNKIVECANHYPIKTYYQMRSNDTLSYCYLTYFSDDYMDTARIVIDPNNRQFSYDTAGIFVNLSMSHINNPNDFRLFINKVYSMKAFL
jgi:hypothetical protein